MRARNQRIVIGLLFSASVGAFWQAIPRAIWRAIWRAIPQAIPRAEQQVNRAIH